MDVFFVCPVSLATLSSTDGNNVIDKENNIVDFPHFHAIIIFRVKIILVEIIRVVD